MFHFEEIAFERNCLPRRKSQCKRISTLCCSARRRRKLIYLILLVLIGSIYHLILRQMDTLYTTGHLHGFPPTFNISSSTSSFYNPAGSTWGNQEGVVALGVVLGSSISLVGLAFAFITYR